MNETVIIALITALTAILAPTVATIIQSVYAYRTRRLELTFEKRIKTYLSFIEQYENFVVLKEQYAPTILISKALDASVIAKQRKLRDKLLAFSALLESEKSVTPELDPLFHECVPLMYREL